MSLLTMLIFCIGFIHWFLALFLLVITPHLFASFLASFFFAYFFALSIVIALQFIAMAIVVDLIALKGNSKSCNILKSDKYMRSKIEIKPWNKVQKRYKKWSKEVKKQYPDYARAAVESICFFWSSKIQNNFIQSNIGHFSIASYCS